METKHLKKYAPKARRDFIQAVTDRAAFYGLSKSKVEPVTVEGDVALITGRAFPKKVADQRKRLEKRIERDGFDQVMEAMAYTWFNRLVAIRFMEIHGYLGHGYRVLSHPEGKSTPEILEHAEHLDLPGLDKQKVIDLKLAGTKESELYRLLITAQCNALHKAMPFLFERIDDETELLLPDNLLHSDSLIRELVGEIPEENWQEVEIIGWLYQFYISEKKDQVIGKVVKSEDIPAATQLFTPNWIVKYMVQNSLGWQWLATYPNSPLKGQMEYYIEPAEQTPEVQKQLDEITPDILNPEEITLLDPACGSGHILVEAYDLFKAIYQERGYRSKDIPRLILEKNLYGLELDDRAAQLASFALLMKARADDRRIFDAPLQLNVMAIQDSKGLDAKEITAALNAPILRKDLPPPQSLFEELDEDKTPLFSREMLSEKGEISESYAAELTNLFREGKTFGSLIQIPEELMKALPAISKRVEDVFTHGEMLEQAGVSSIRRILKQAQMLSRKYDAVVANPPYMGSGAYNQTLKKYVLTHYSEGKSDLYAAFIIRNLLLLNENGYVGMITIPNWMFLGSFEKLRHLILDCYAIVSLIHNGRGVWGSDFGSCSFVLKRGTCIGIGQYLKLFSKQGEVKSNADLERAFFDRSTFPIYQISSAELRVIPGSPIAYSISPLLRSVFAQDKPISEFAQTASGLQTNDNNRFIRYWHEVAFTNIGFNFSSRSVAGESNFKWFPHVKGGAFRKWYGNLDYVVNWGQDGKEIIALAAELYGSPTRTAKNLDLYFSDGVTWTDVSSSLFGVRRLPPGCIFDTSAPSLFSEDWKLYLGFLLTPIVGRLLNAISPNLHFLAGDIASLPFLMERISAHKTDIESAVSNCVNISKSDWDSLETSWDFIRSPLNLNLTSLENAWNERRLACDKAIKEMQNTEEHINRLFIEAYGLEGEIAPEVFEDQITLGRADRVGDMKNLISYVIGCMMGRYSLDKPGLIYAHSGNEGFDASQYVTFPADEDGIIPITEMAWFEDDAANRLERFIAIAWDEEHLEENLKFIAESLDGKKKDHPREVIRKYLSTGFYKHHLSIYKRCPIYWLFSSGKQRAFQCLVYLHRYNEGTLARMRTEYVIPLQGKMSSRISQLEGDIAAADSTSHRRKLEKEKEALIKQREELQAFDETLRHYADKRISLDLDDGVKVNYGKFGDLLAEVKAVTGDKGE